MEFPSPLTRAIFDRREKRFFIHAHLPDGTPVVAHTNNTGAMRGCLFPGGDIYLSPARNPARKLRWTLELTRTEPDGVLVGVNTMAANTLVREALESGPLKAGLAGSGLPNSDLANSDLPNSTTPNPSQPDILPPGGTLRAEVRYGRQGSRADFLATSDQGARTWIEVKNVSLVEDGHARFPDAPTERGRKHLQELAAMVAAGDRAALVFCVQRADARSVGPADDIDPAYGQLLREVAAQGVEVYGVVCRAAPQASPRTLRPQALLPIILGR